MDQNYDVDDYVWQSANNRVRLIGKIVSKPVLYLDNDKMKYYMVLVNIPTQHGNENLIPLVANEILVNKNKANDFFYDKKVLVRGFLTTVKLTKDGKPVFDQCVIIKKITTDVPNFKFSNVGFVRGTMVGFTKINNERRYSRTFLRVPSDLEYDPNVCMTTEYPLSWHLEKLHIGSEVYFKFYLLGFNREVPARTGLKAKVFIGTNDFEHVTEEELTNLDVNFKGNIVDKYVPKHDGFVANDDPALVEMDEKLGIAQKLTRCKPPLDSYTPPPEKDEDGIFYIN